MNKFPTTEVGGIKLSRLICGTNWFLGYSHTSAAKDKFIRELFATPEKIAAVIETFARYGINAVMGPANPLLADAILMASDRVGQKIHYICTPHYEIGRLDTWKQAIETARKYQASFCFPHQCMTDPQIDVARRCLSEELMTCLKLVREAGMVPGLSSHTPHAVICSDACGADVESYIQPYNAAGFLCQIETDWLQKCFREAKKPVMTIKPLAAGRLLPPTGLTFVWNTIRPCDLVTIGVLSSYEAQECIELSLACLEKRSAQVELQFTRSKKSLV
ncbi:MAG TPA: hypothetical protein PK644_06545 [bacterium]|nr:hypothetical protein [bacterium]